MTNERREAIEAYLIESGAIERIPSGIYEGAIAMKELTLQELVEIVDGWGIKMIADDLVRRVGCIPEFKQ